MYAEKRPVGRFDTDEIGYSVRQPHLINDSGTVSVHSPFDRIKITAKESANRALH